MGYTIEGAGADSTTAYVATQAQLLDTLGGEPVGNDGDKVLVFEVPGNQFAFVIEGTYTQLLDLLRQAEAAVLAGVTEEDLTPPPVPEALEGLVAPGEDYWTTEQMRERFAVEGFAAPYVVVQRKEDGQPGLLKFTHQPRFYYGWEAAS